MRRSLLTLILTCVVACRGGTSETSTGASTGGTTEEATASLTADSTGGDRCGDGVAAEGEVCFKIGRRTTKVLVAILLPGDFDGDGTREYYADPAGREGEYWFMADGGTAMTSLHKGRFATQDDFDRAVFRASARDIDLDGKTDLLTLVEYETFDGHVGGGAAAGMVMWARPGFEFSPELLLLNGSGSEATEEDAEYFDGTFGDFDGDGLAELFFARNLRHSVVLYVEPGAAEGELFEHGYVFDLTPLALEKGIVSVAVDLDGNGRDDLVLADGVGRVWTLYSDPDGVLVPHTLTETPVLPAMVSTVLAQDVDGDGIIDLVGAATHYDTGKFLPGEFAIARGTGDGGFEPLAAWTASSGPTHTSGLWVSQTDHVHLVLLDLDGSGYPALVYALRDEHKLVVHPQVGRTLGADPVVLPLDLEPAGIFADPQDDGTVDLLVSLRRGDNGTEDDESDDYGPFIDRYRLDP